MKSGVGKYVRRFAFLAGLMAGVLTKNADAEEAIANKAFLVTPLQETFSNTYRAKSSVVCRVKASIKDKETAQIGSGFFISENGHLLTTASTVNGGNKFIVEYQKKGYEATLLGLDEVTNVALLKIEGLPSGASYVVLSETRALPEITTFLISLSYKLEFGITPALGYVEGHDVAYFEHLWPTTLLRTNLKMDGGDGGGSVFDVQGNLIGMLVYSLKDTQQGAYIMPVRVLAKVCNDLLLFGKVRYGYVGIETESVLDKLNDRLCQRVINIQPNSPAEKAGIHVNDVLLSLDEKPIQSREELINFAFFTYPAQKITVVFLREGKEQKITVEVGSRP